MTRSLEVQKDLFQSVLFRSANLCRYSGEDFDELVLQYLLSEFKKKEGVDLSKDVFAIQRLREGAEQAKKALDHMSSYEINLPFITREKNFSYTLSKDKFNELIKPLVERTVKPCEAALKVCPTSSGTTYFCKLLTERNRMPAFPRLIMSFWSAV